MEVEDFHVRQIKIGVIGLGKSFEEVHLPAIRNSRDLQLTALCDCDENRLRWAAKECSVPEEFCFTNFHDLLGCPEVDAVGIFTPNDCHFVMVCAAAQAQKPYLLETPVALTGEEAEILTEITEQNQVKSMLCFPYRYRAGIRYLRSLIARGVLGTVYHISLHSLKSDGLPSADSPFGWRFSKAKAGSGVLGDLGSQALDLISFITGQEYLSVMGCMDTFLERRRLPDEEETEKVDVDDFCSCTVELSGKTWVDFQMSRFAFGKKEELKLEIFASEGSLAYTFDGSSGRETLTGCYGKIGFETQSFAEIAIPEEQGRNQMDAFVDLLLEREDGFSAGIREGQLNQNLLENIIDSAKKKEWVTV